jgi:hypothetical protein
MLSSPDTLSTRSEITLAFAWEHVAAQAIVATVNAPGSASGAGTTKARLAWAQSHIRACFQFAPVMTAGPAQHWRSDGSR